MLIDWFTVIAQVLNFLILVWLMKRFLYKPILQAIDTREKLIEARLTDAKTKKAEAKKERDEFQKKNEEFDNLKAGLLTKAAEEAKVERQRLLDEARKDSDALRGKQKESLGIEFKNLSGEIARRTGQEVFSITRKALSDLASTTLEEQMVGVFVRRLNELDDKNKVALKDAFQNSSDTATVRSTFDIPTSQQSSVKEALSSVLANGTTVNFETSPDLVSGIELNANGCKVSWSIAEYLDSLESSVGELVSTSSKPDRKKS